ncbi:MAG TPA: phosphopyruvate hydratase [Methanomassiliicoccales archaeon]|jgi:enolase
MSDHKITKVWAREVLDSRGNPTVEAEVSTPTVTVSAIAPSGASTGTHEAVEFRDGGPRYGGKGVLKAVENIRKIIAPVLVGMDVTDLKAIDLAMIALDGTENKSRLGGNATTAVSFACARTGAIVKGVPLHEHLGKGSHVLPVPSMNVINGGKHAGGNLRPQEFMISPVGAKTFAESLRYGAEVYQALKSVLKDAYGVGAINVGDEGGFAPPMNTVREALDTLVKAIEKADYVPGRDVSLAMDPAASEFFEDGEYVIDGVRLDPGQMVGFYEDLLKDYPIVSLEDPFDEEAFDTFAQLTKDVGKKLQIVGDDLFVTNVRMLRKAVPMGAGNALLLKVNQVGTITEALEASDFAFKNRYNVMVSHRSGESEDTTIADIAVAIGCGQIKTGAPCRAERTCKYNRLVRIEEALGQKAKFAGVQAFRSQ